MGVPKGLSCFARSASTWIHCRSPGHSANWLIRGWSSKHQSDTPNSRPTHSLICASEKLSIFDPRSMYYHEHAVCVRRSPLSVSKTKSLFIELADTGLIKLVDKPN